MRLLALLTVAGCGFSVASTEQQTPDAPPDTTVHVTWDLDATSHKAVPASSAQWQDLFAANALQIMPPQHLWLMQESSGNLADTLGTATLAPKNVVTYHDAVTGWSRFAVSTTDRDGDQGFVSTAAGNQDGGSYVMLVYVAVSAPSAERSLFGIGAASDHHLVGLTSGAKVEARTISGNVATGTQAMDTSVRPIVLRITPWQQKVVVYTPQERVQAPWSTLTGAGDLVTIGSASLGSPTAHYLYGALWSGAAAEISDAQIKSMLTSMGWTVSGF